ncbi:hypothetical protein [Gymnodinialimonas ceratoperidinii]|uniref:Uncharacterized protein n=1 Tax=Gymnodinialimonas ceratoperidinii TaxID=2856823 RepID=A0A8F6TTW6_9RHOB|nr:hypothetical protein [Gymnodinialimonas ceratoperidinii]QXT38630.1 hypothetical protein KYE46_11870 [Gymnodinialimonas ceratoperidinii]
MSDVPLTADDMAALTPQRLSNLERYDDGFRTVEVVNADDKVWVLTADADGGDLTTLTEPGRFAQTWARLAPHLVGLSAEVGTPSAEDGLRHEIAVHLPDGTALRWVGHGEDNDVYHATAAFGMEGERDYADLDLEQVDQGHPMMTAPLGDWP